MDRIDWQIIDILFRDSRISYSGIGKIVGLGKDTVQKRVKKLMASGIIGKPYPILDSKRCGFEGIIDFFLRLRPDDTKEIDNEIAKLPYILMMGKAAGDYNLYFSSFYRNLDDIKAIINVIEKVTNILSYETLVYSNDAASPMVMPFISENPSNSIIYKLKEKETPKANL